MKPPRPTLTHLNKARKEFKAIEPRDFFYWSVTKLVAAVFVAERSERVVDELVRALMMLLTTWNKNYYRFYQYNNPEKTLEAHFVDLEIVIAKHYDSLMNFRNQELHKITVIPELEIRDIFEDFTRVLGRVGAAKCLHLLAPRFFPLWDAAILKGYGLENAEYRHRNCK